MSHVFSVDEILEIAQQIEKNGYNFYKAAAKKFPEHRQLLSELAEQEVLHEKYFVELRKSLPSFQNEDDVDELTTAYLRSMADAIVFDTRHTPDDLLSNINSVEGVIRFALGKEKDTVLYYSGIRDMIKDDKNKLAMYELIKEEMRHIMWLNDWFKKNG